MYLVVLFHKTLIFFNNFLIAPYLRLPSFYKLIIFLLLFIFTYHFFVFFIWRPSKKKLLFWQVIIYIAMLCSIYLLRFINYYYYQLLFESGYSRKIYYYLIRPSIHSGTVVLIICVVSIVIVRLFFKQLLIKKKKLVHGPVFNHPDVSQDKGFPIGRYLRDVLPGHISEFASGGNKDILVPFDSLSRTTAILGDMGSGKSRLMYLFQDAIRKYYPDIPVLIHDPKGEWLRTYYDPKTDIIFAPYDKRSCAWHLWEDFRKYPELRFSVISTAIESHHSGSHDVFWSHSATALLKDASHCNTLEDARTYLYSEKERNETDNTFRSIFTSSLISFRDMVSVELAARRKDTRALSIDDFLHFPGRIFLLNNPACASEQHGALTLLLSAFLLRAISLPDVPAGELRAAAIIDETLTFRLPPDVELPVYSQCRSKGLAIIASAQRLPSRQEQGAWASHSANIFGMRVSDLATRKALSERIGMMRYNEPQKSTSSGDKSFSTTKSQIQRDHAALAPEDFGKLRNKEFILFHDYGVSPGIVKNVLKEQRDVKTFIYNDRKDVSDFMSLL